MPRVDLRKWDPVTGKLTHRRDGSSVRTQLRARSHGTNLPASGIEAQGLHDPVKHGARSAALVDPVAAELVTAVTAVRPDLANPVYGPALQRWATAEARCLLLRAWLAEHGELDEDGEPRPAARFLLENERAASRASERLGLDPLSEAQLAVARRQAGITAGLGSQEDALRRLLDGDA